MRALELTGAGGWVGRGVGFAVACGVGFAVGFAVGSGVRCGVAVGASVAATVGFGVADAAVGLGRFATIGPLGTTGGTGSADGATDGMGFADGAIDGSSEGPTVGATVLEVGVGVGVGTGSATVGLAGRELALGAIGDVLGVGLASAMSPGGRDGATTPAVSATVARTRLRSPMATTSRAR